MAPARTLSLFITRPAAEEDRDWLYALKRATMRPYVEKVFGWNEDDQRRRFDEDFDPAAKRIILVDGHEAGMFEVHDRRDHRYLAQLEILPAFQNRGLGAAVVGQVIEDAARAGRHVELQVLRPNPARRLYERMGFSVHAETPTHFQMRRGRQGA
ncbi:MAG TPA: GNAT family N-acetyltransferase [Candidatus Didemnitutus sp.]|nr:GNAT family N-acetyltransferase [Candidatus Didemnitutus sp.]